MLWKNVNLTIYIRAGMAEAGPPLGTTLGNIGVNTLNFCKEFNNYTQELPNYFTLKVKIAVTESRSFTFSVELPSTGLIINLLKKDVTEINKDGITIFYQYILLEDLLKLSKFKFPLLPSEKSSKIIKGSLFTANIKILLNDVIIKE